jgi:hypothetical protein
VEEIVLVLLQLVGELLVEILIYLPFDWPLPKTRDLERTGPGVAILYVLLGATLGGLSIAVLPDVLLPYGWLRLLNLVLAPLVCGAVSWQVARWRARGSRGTRPRNHFWYGAGFVFAFATVRFIFATR